MQGAGRDFASVPWDRSNLGCTGDSVEIMSRIPPDEHDIEPTQLSTKLVVGHTGKDFARRERETFRVGLCSLTMTGS
jgi:hypothetical protein